MAEEKEYGKGSQIDVDRLVKLKNKVKNECLRRKYNGSVEAYGGSAYDFQVEPKVNGVMSIEHYNKNAEPLRAINSSNPNNVKSGDVSFNDTIVLMDAQVSAYELTAKTDNSHNDCSQSCSGLCLNCTGTCINGCNTTCYSACQNDCTNTCSGCSDACSGCSGSCSGGCYGNCQNTCSGTCTVTCGNNGCSGLCSTSCSNGSCVSGCQKSCGGCGVGSCSGVCTNASTGRTT